MNEQEVESNEDVFRFLITVDDSVHSKFYNMTDAVTIAQGISGITNDDIEIHTIH